ncbi:hypothetical protein BKE38_22420 [Pseudoroseomonas deserti]|uniref:Uncharacterized protein n=1 Tax=Teichococcus deserti TaxID=1817963 RepID=A0A1V2GWW2_9PROT|nr:hypothetical protein [Pseudoroseomonas deserti]ONG47976.1 hypothetical protein BKE38_22420 [Pseudoroseomonas deserti]
MKRAISRRSLPMVAVSAGIAIPVLMEGSALDAELLSLLAEAERLWHADGWAPAGQTLAELLAPRPWEAVLCRAAKIPATTPAGLRAKARAVTMLLTLPSGEVPQWAGPCEHLMLGLQRDLDRLEPSA